VAKLARFDFRSRWTKDEHHRLGLTPVDARDRRRRGQAKQKKTDNEGEVAAGEAEKPTLTKERRQQFNLEAKDSAEVEPENQTLHEARDAALDIVYQQELSAAIEAEMQGAPDDEVALLAAVLKNGGRDWSAARREAGQKTRAAEKRLRRRLEESEELRGLVAGE
jgi:hypothetical protein